MDLEFSAPSKNDTLKCPSRLGLSISVNWRGILINNLNIFLGIEFWPVVLSGFRGKLMSDCSWVPTQNQLVQKRTLNDLAKPNQQSNKFPILRLFQARNSLTFRQVQIQHWLNSYMHIAKIESCIDTFNSNSISWVKKKDFVLSGGRKSWYPVIVYLI